MKTYEVKLHSEPSVSFIGIKAAQSMDIDIEKKLKHELTISADIDTPFSIGLIIGSSGSGKTTLAKNMFGDDCFESKLSMQKCIIDQFPDSMEYNQISKLLTGVGLSSVPCWIRPVYTLSNGQRFRAEVALKLAQNTQYIAIDEWTSVVDRTVAKAMSNAIQKAIRRENNSAVFCSCHYDVIEWLQPDWIIDCNKGTYEDRRSLQQIRREKLSFDIKEVDKSTWRYFSRYHYLSENLPGGKIYTFGLFYGEEQIGFQCFANYVPGRTNVVHSNRTVIHPDYVGFGLGMKLINASSSYMKEQYNVEIFGKFSNYAIYKSMLKDPNWKLVDTNTKTPDKLRGTYPNRSIDEHKVRNKVRWFSFKFDPVR